MAVTQPGGGLMETLEKPSPLQGFVDKWLGAQPRQHVALAFVDGRRFPGHLALAAFEQEMLDGAYGVREPQAVVAKLQWWVAELSDAPNSGGQHPLTQTLFADERAAMIPTPVWTAPALAAVAQLEQGTAADFAAQLVAGQALHGALAALETAWWYGPQASAERATSASLLTHLLHALGRLAVDVEKDRLPLPMARLAQQGLDRLALHKASPARDAAVKAQLRDLLAQWAALPSQPGPLSVFRAVESHLARQLARRALHAADSLAQLNAPSPRPSLLLAFHAWRAARVWQRLRPAADGLPSAAL